MINFILDKIQLRNVRRYGDDVMEMDFPLNNLTVFTGKVGAGKSTILKAVSMALYGEDGGAKGEKLSIDDMINEKNGKNLEIHLFFHSVVDNQSNETKYEIHLFHKHSKYNNRLVFVKDGKDISLESKTATYELIEKTLIPKNVYHNVYYFTQQCKNFFTALPNTEQKEIFNAILDLSEYKDYYNNTKQKLDELEVKLTGANVKLKSNSDNVVVFRNLHDKALKDLEDDKEHVKSRCEELDLLISDLENRISEYNSSIYDTDINNEISNLNLKIQKFQSDINNNISIIKMENVKIAEDFKNVTTSTLKDKYVKIRLERSKDVDSNISQLKIDLEKNNGDLSKIQKDLEIQKLSDIQKIKNEYQQKIDDIKQKIQDLKTKCKDLDNNLVIQLGKLKDDIQLKVDVIKDEKSKLTAAKEKINFQLQSNSKKKKELVEKIEEYSNSLNEPDAVCSLCGQPLKDKEHVKKHIQDLKKQCSEIDELDEVSNSKIKDIELTETKDNNLLEDLKKVFYDQKDSYNTTCEENKKSFNVEIDNNTNLYKELESQCSSKLEELNQKYDSVLTKQTVSLKNAIDVINSKIAECNNLKNKIDDELRLEYKEEYNLKKKILDDTVCKNTNVIQDLQSKLDSFLKENNVVLQRLNNRKDEIEKTKQTIHDLEMSILKYKQEQESYTNKTYFEKRITTIRDTEKCVTDSVKNLEDSKKIVKDLEKEKSILEFWKGAFSDSGIKSMLIDSAIPHMNECVMNELDRVAPGKFTVSFDTLSETKTGKVKDKFCINIVNNERQSTGHKKLSGGEKRIIDLCCMSALRSLAEKLYNKRFCHIFYDEILDSLDDECKQQFCANVKLQSTSGCNVTLVTHDLPEDVDPDRVFPF